MPSVLVLSGPPGAGKSSVAERLVARVPRGVLLAQDDFFAAVRSGFIPPWREESGAQNEAVVRACAAAAAEFARHGYDVVVEGIVLPWALAHYRDLLGAADIVPVYQVLLPSSAAVLARGLPRPDKAIVTPAIYAQMHAQFAAVHEGTPLDTTALDLEATVAAVIRQTGFGAD